MMGYKHNRHVPIPQFPDYVHQDLALPDGQGCCGLVENNGFRISGKRFGDLHQLLFRSGQVVDQRPRLDPVDVHLF